MVEKGGMKVVNLSTAIRVESLSSEDCEGDKTTKEVGSTSSTEEWTGMIDETVHGEGSPTVDADWNRLNEEKVRCGTRGES
jgi:hypothetical protein